jgi:hypothetical protein
MNKVKVTYRGWGGHFIGSKHCLFRLNTLLELGTTRVVVSTVGGMIVHAKAEPIAYLRYYETMAFHAKLENGYWEADTTQDIPVNGKRCVDHIDIHADQEAQEMHEAAVLDISNRMITGDIVSEISTQEEITQEAA